ncbi:MAG TPA: rod shape-determining protein MreC [Acidimicrobiia bacterium]|nr:rod shape-determining protein MreC [Acidimicrobiia bacterium]
MAMYRRGNRRRRYVLLLLVLTAITLITLDRRSDDEGPLGVVGRVAHHVVNPIVSGVDWVADPVGDWFAGVFDGGSLKDENDELRDRVDELERELDEVDSALEENRQFKDLLALPITDDIDRVYARVIAGAPGNFEQTLTLNKGSADGIVEDMPVIAARGLVGRVIEVWGNGSKVLLLTDPRSGVGVRLVPSRVTGVAQGRAGSDTLALQIGDVDIDIAEGDQAETSGLEGSTYPPNLPVGAVGAVAREPGGTGQRVRVVPFVRFADVEHVMVLKWAPGSGPVVTTTTTAPPTTTSTTSTTAPTGEASL